ncbi:probable serine/threonine-protein kinase clkA [Patella vulgata]|uniref:probable serine/threonine-protein kinase clkA n=1 Tax=Patella vulgata TaxID=6465 RepID=UPI00218037A8|nr:probable serine/threonine-protein kinase clkA [Patella vulgata]
MLLTVRLLTLFQFVVLLDDINGAVILHKTPTVMVNPTGHRPTLASSLVKRSVDFKHGYHNQYKFLLPRFRRSVSNGDKAFHTSNYFPTAPKQQNVYSPPAPSTSSASSTNQNWNLRALEDDNYNTRANRMTQEDDFYNAARGSLLYAEDDYYNYNNQPSRFPSGSSYYRQPYYEHQGYQNQNIQTGGQYEDDRKKRAASALKRSNKSMIKKREVSLSNLQIQDFPTQQLGERILGNSDNLNNGQLGVTGFDNQALGNVAYIDDNYSNNQGFGNAGYFDNNYSNNQALGSTGYIDDNYSNNLQNPNNQAIGGSGYIDDNYSNNQQYSNNQPLGIAGYNDDILYANNQGVGSTRYMDDDFVNQPIGSTGLTNSQGVANAGYYSDDYTPNNQPLGANGNSNNLQLGGGGLIDDDFITNGQQIGGVAGGNQADQMGGVDGVLSQVGRRVIEHSWPGRQVSGVGVQDAEDVATRPVSGLTGADVHHRGRYPYLSNIFNKRPFHLGGAGEQRPIASVTNNPTATVVNVTDIQFPQPNPQNNGVPKPGRYINTPDNPNLEDKPRTRVNQNRTNSGAPLPLLPPNAVHETRKKRDNSDWFNNMFNGRGDDYSSQVGLRNQAMDDDYYYYAVNFNGGNAGDDYNDYFNGFQRADQFEEDRKKRDIALKSRTDNQINKASLVG